MDVSVQAPPHMQARRVAPMPHSPRYVLSSELTGKSWATSRWQGRFGSRTGRAGTPKPQRRRRRLWLLLSGGIYVFPWPFPSWLMFGILPIFPSKRPLAPISRLDAGCPYIVCACPVVQCTVPCQSRSWTSGCIAPQFKDGDKT